MSTVASKFFLLFFILVSFSACKKDDEQPVEEDPFAENRKALGASSEDLLSSDFYKTLTVELVYSEIYRPTQTAIDNLRTFLMERVNKPQGINFVETLVPEQPNDPFTIQEIRDIEDQLRTKYTEGNNIAVYLFFSNGSSTNDTPTTVTLGTAYRNTSIVIYERTLQVISNNDEELLSIIESTTMNHELGHILGLTNISGDDIHAEHEDQSNLKHCFIEECLMYFDATSVTRSMIERMKGRMMIPQLDPLCIEDLQAKGGL
ncbi:MAG: membrane metalloprotease [Flavobacteriaceae bacterium]|nr:membrane metalloprotease [Flavobacteriaceae bacterium]